MPLRTVRLPGSIYLVPARNLDTGWRRKRQDHPHLPADLQHIRGELQAMQTEGGVPATVEAPQGAGKDQSLLIYGHNFVLRLFPSTRGDGYIIASVDPLRLADHQRLAAGYLQLRPARWECLFELSRIPPGSRACWRQILSAWSDCARESAVRPPTDLTAKQAAFLDTLDRLIKADEKISTEATRSARPYPYRDVKPTTEQRRAAYAVYEFQVIGQAPEQGTLVQVRGEPEQRGQVTRIYEGSVTIRFDQPVSWDRIPRQGQLEQTPSTVVYRKQQEAVALLRSGQARNPSLLSVMADFRTAPVRPAADKPTEVLDDDQLTAFRKGVGVEDMLMVLGPPGTGKTRVISQVAQACALGVPGIRDPGRVLVTSHTHRAVDNVLARLPRDLLRIRVGHDGKVTAEGRPYLLESQASELKARILNDPARALSAYEDVSVAQGWARELADRTGELAMAVGAEERARSGFEAARRAAGGAAYDRVDALTTEYGRREQSLARLARRGELLARRASRARDRSGWPLVGFVFGLLVRRWDRRRASAQQDAARLSADQERTRSELAAAGQELDAVTRDQPAVRAARAALTEAARHRTELRTAAFAAAQACGDIVRRVDTPPPLAADGGLDAAERELPGFQAWLAQRLPVLEARAKLLAEWHGEVSGATDQLYPELIRYADVVAATCIGAASRPELSDVEFDLAIVDEAGQIGVANVLVPLVRARRGMLVGDHQQLPPYLDAAMQAWGAGIGDPVIRDLLAKSALELLVDRLDPASVVRLTWQRRMPSTIADFVSAAFYGGTLHTDVRREHRDPIFSRAMAFVDTASLCAVERYEKSGVDHERWDQPGYINLAEASLLTELAAFYQRRGADWAVIVPYVAQVEKITGALTPLIGDAELTRLNVGTVDSFQGGERDVILYGFTRSNPDGRVGFLDELRRANVAFTRARHLLVLVGDLDTLTMARDRRFRDLARSLRGYLAERGDIRQYREVCDRLEQLRNPAGTT
ncbi:MAG TPA: ATP-binding protein [Streptosporangiaceae bacterium]|nr:ATP-binding protein [Streptosporangiaceae bacterium]